MVDNHLDSFISLKNPEDEKDPRPSLILVAQPDPVFAQSEGRPFMFVGTRGAADSLENLEQNKITHVLICAKFFKPSFEGKFVYKSLPLVDKPSFDLRPYIQEAFDFIEQCRRADGAILLHCSVGKSRSCAIAISYCMRKLGLSFDQAFE